MLILTRRIGETLIIGDGEEKVEVTVLAIKGNQIRIGIEAPAHIDVHRLEIYNRIKNGLWINKEDLEHERLIAS